MVSVSAVRLESSMSAISSCHIGTIRYHFSYIGSY